VSFFISGGKQMAVATKENVMERTVEQPKTFKMMEAPPTQEYHYLHRVVGPMALPDGTLNGDMLDLEVMNWLQGGYRIVEVHFLGQHKGVDGNVHGYVYGYHLVKG
jgi:hypothetical protein